MKVSTYKKFGDLKLKTVTLGEVFKNTKYPEIVKENVWEFAWHRDWEGIACPSNAISVKFSVLKNFASATVFNIKFPNFRHLLTFTCSFHFWRLQSVNVRFSIVSRTVKRSQLSRLLKVRIFKLKVTEAISAESYYFQERYIEDI